MNKAKCFDPFAHNAKGYAKLAAQMGQLPETAIFRRFGALNARNLLYLQSELTSLEEALEKAEDIDSKNGKGEKDKYAADYYWLQMSEHDGDTYQLKLMMKIRSLLKEYNKALYYQSALFRLERPDKFDLRDIQGFMNDDSMGLPLTGPDQSIWGSCTEPDQFCKDGLVSLRPRERPDPFSKWLAEHAIMFRHRVFKMFKSPDSVHGMIGYHDSSVFRLTAWLNGMIASVLPVVSIVCLINVGTVVSRLGVIAGFNILISICLRVFTDAKRKDVFAVTAV
ncbi:hypothetical protein P280DRAFT_537296 [Massarina eburnea CBS 473.64]|uniref:DUF6594 domain-containing protein n=1 Tax=Massarina eburnea CBS 473.64 TaxID=1395130 RepID=A0A6A6S902_9PLEO|nr:hypothetical protein P280DRAFT_537296 [Massarina eburnea CBS 473.64]